MRGDRQEPSNAKIVARLSESRQSHVGYTLSADEERTRIHRELQSDLIGETSLAYSTCRRLLCGFIGPVFERHRFQ